MPGWLSGSDVYVRVTRNRFRVRDIDSGAEVTVESDAPFTSERMLIGDFAIAQRTLKGAIKQVAKDRFIRMPPRLLVQPLDMLKEGLAETERRILMELAIGAGARKVVVWVGAELGDLDVRRKLDGKQNAG